VGCAPPFSRRARDERDEPDEWAISSVYDFIAEAYGWGRDYVDDVLTDEQLVAYLDAAEERLEARQRAEFRGWVEAVRVGSIFARDQRQYGRWASSSRAKGRRGLTGHALEQAVMRIASMFPANVEVGGRP
jgi:leucyl aminopeptidase (aminopeptidase T)